MAMISKRHYRQQLSVKEGLEEIVKFRGAQFDPRVVDAFLKVMKDRTIQEKIVFCVQDE